MKKVILFTCAMLGFSLTANAQHFIGESYGGGVVFSVSQDGQHGWIAETQDQGTCNWWQAELMAAHNHSEAGSLFPDWRLPNRDVLKAMYSQKDAIGGFSKYTTYYWSSGELDKYTGWAYMFPNGGWYNVDKKEKYLVRAVRSF